MGQDLNLQSIAETHEQPFVIIDEDARIVAANRAFLLAHGARLEEVLHRYCWEVTHHSTRPCHELGEECPNEYIRRTGRPHACLHVHTHRDAHQRVQQVRVKGFPLDLGDGRRLYAELFEELSTGGGEGDDEQSSEPLMLGSSPAFLASLEQMQAAARSGAPVLIQGETGTGKELAARFVHRNSARAAGPFQTLDCTVLTDGLVASELFGHARGAFTGSAGARQGLFKLADGGSLFLDEIGELPMGLQAKLLRVLESGEVRPLGSDRNQRTDVRIICATNRDLRLEMQHGNFRPDLYYRLACLGVHLPSLRERREDIPELARYLLGRLSRHGGRRSYLSDGAISALMAHDYPGNIRELRNILHAAAAQGDSSIVHRAAVTAVLGVFGSGAAAGCAPVPQPTPRPAVAPRVERANETDAPARGTTDSLEAIERDHLRRLLAQHNGSRTAVAAALGVSVRTVYRKLKRFELR
jgi:PAS domain S-box-containing protein